MRLRNSLLILALLAVPSLVHANEVSLRWDPVQVDLADNLVLEYEVCYSVTGGEGDFNTCQVVAEDNEDVQGNSPGMHMTGLGCQPIWWRVRAQVRRTNLTLPPTTGPWSNVVNDYPTVEGTGQPFCGPVPSDVMNLKRSDVPAADSGGN